MKAHGPEDSHLTTLPGKEPPNILVELWLEQVSLIFFSLGGAAVRGVGTRPKGLGRSILAERSSLNTKTLV